MTCSFSSAVRFAEQVSVCSKLVSTNKSSSHPHASQRRVLRANCCVSRRLGIFARRIPSDMFNAVQRYTGSFALSPVKRAVGHCVHESRCNGTGIVYLQPSCRDYDFTTEKVTLLSFGVVQPRRVCQPNQAASGRSVFPKMIAFGALVYARCTLQPRFRSLCTSQSPFPVSRCSLSAKGSSSSQPALLFSLTGDRLPCPPASPASVPGQSPGLDRPM